MIMTIGPLVEAAADSSAKKALGAHGVGLLAGSSLTFGLIGAAGVVMLPSNLDTRVQGEVLWLIAILALVSRLPQSRWQVPPGWLRTHPVAGAFGYGSLLGTGVATKAPYGVWLAALVLAFGSGSMGFALLSGLAYAAGRWFALALVILLPDQFPYMSVAEWFLRLPPFLRGADRTLLLVAGALLVAPR